MTDNELLSLFQSGNEEAITAIKDKYHHYLYKISYQILGDNEDVEECLNDIWLAAWKAIPKDVPEKLLPYLRKITRDISIDRLRKRSSKKKIPSEYLSSIDELSEVIPSCATPETELEAKELNEAIGKFIETLSEAQRSLFISRYYFFDPISDIAGNLRTSEGKVRSSLFRIRKKLKTYLNQEGFDI